MRLKIIKHLFGLPEQIGWSYDLLNLEEKRLFMRLSVFVGGWTMLRRLSASLPSERSPLRADFDWMRHLSSSDAIPSSVLRVADDLGGFHRPPPDKHAQTHEQYFLL